MLQLSLGRTLTPILVCMGKPEDRKEGYTTSPHLKQVYLDCHNKSGVRSQDGYSFCMDDVYKTVSVYVQHLISHS